MVVGVLRRPACKVTSFRRLVCWGECRAYVLFWQWEDLRRGVPVDGLRMAEGWWGGDPASAWGPTLDSRFRGNDGGWVRE